MLATVFSLMLMGPLQSADYAAPSGTISALKQCFDIALPADRLICLEGVARKLVDAEKQGDIVLVDRPTMKKTRRSLFGFNLPQVKLFGAGDRTGSDEADGSLETTIVSARPEKYDRWTLDLAEGGRWQTTEPWSYGPSPRTGAAIKLDRGALGSYSIKTPNARPVRARRIE